MKKITIVVLALFFISSNLTIKAEVSENTQQLADGLSSFTELLGEDTSKRRNLWLISLIEALQSSKNNKATQISKKLGLIEDRQEQRILNHIIKSEQLTIGEKYQELVKSLPSLGLTELDSEEISNLTKFARYATNGKSGKKALKKASLITSYIVNPENSSKKQEKFVERFYTRQNDEFTEMLEESTSVEEVVAIVEESTSVEEEAIIEETQEEDTSIIDETVGVSIPNTNSNDDSSIESEDETYDDDSYAENEDETYDDDSSVESENEASNDDSNVEGEDETYNDGSSVEGEDETYDDDSYAENEDDNYDITNNNDSNTNDDSSGNNSSGKTNTDGNSSSTPSFNDSIDGLSDDQLSPDQWLINNSAGIFHPKDNTLTVSFSTGVNPGESRIHTQTEDIWGRYWTDIKGSAYYRISFTCNDIRSEKACLSSIIDKKVSQEVSIIYDYTEIQWGVISNTQKDWYTKHDIKTDYRFKTSEGENNPASYERELSYYLNNEVHIPHQNRFETYTEGTENSDNIPGDFSVTQIQWDNEMQTSSGYSVVNDEYETNDFMKIWGRHAYISQNELQIHAEKLLKAQFPGGANSNRTYFPSEYELIHAYFQYKDSFTSQY